MPDPLLIYGATGYTGHLIVRCALECGLRPILCGRNEVKLAVMAERFGLDYRVARLSEPERLDQVLRDMQVVLHVAGPFSETSRPMVDACLRTGTHYLDITGEIPVMEALARRDAEARRRKIMIMPGTGFDVVPSDCLVAHVARRLPRAQHLWLGLTGLEFSTRGSAKTLVEHASYGVNLRRDGVITPVAPFSLQRSFDYGGGPRPSVNVSWGDVSAAYYTTGIPNIEVYFEITPRVRAILMSTRYFGPIFRSPPWQAWLKACAEMLPEGPSAAERAAAKMIIVAEVEDGMGRRAIARLHTPEAYACTGLTAPAIAQRVLTGDLEVGFQTPARVFGPDFILSLPGVCREGLV